MEVTVEKAGQKAGQKADSLQSIENIKFYEIKEEKRQFICESFQYIQILFGLTSAGSVYSRMLDMAMKKVDRDFWTSYLDATLTFSGEPWAYLGHLTQVVLAHTAAGIKMQPCKTKLFQSKVEYLGHKISKGGVSMIPEYIQEDHRLARTEDRKRSSYVLGIRQVLLNLHTKILGVN